MRKESIFLFLGILLPMSCVQAKSLQTTSKCKATMLTEKSSLKVELKGMQEQVQRAFYTDMTLHKDEELSHLIHQLTAAAEGRSASGVQLIAYWQSYALYYNAIYYMQHQQLDKASEAVTKGISLLENRDQKTSEDYAMLSRLEGLSLAFADSKAAQLSHTMMEHSALAIELDSSNPRAYVVAAIGDFFTPKAYGGRTRVKALLTKALELPTQVVKSDYNPSWGREEAYEYLLRYLLEEEGGKGAKELLDKALVEFPYSYQLRSINIKPNP